MLRKISTSTPAPLPPSSSITSRRRGTLVLMYYASFGPGPHRFVGSALAPVLIGGEHTAHKIFPRPRYLTHTDATAVFPINFLKPDLDAYCRDDGHSCSSVVRFYLCPVARKWSCLPYRYISHPRTHDRVEPRGQLRQGERGGGVILLPLTERMKAVRRTGLRLEGTLHLCPPDVHISSTRIPSSTSNLIKVRAGYDTPTPA